MDAPRYAFYIKQLPHAMIVIISHICRKLETIFKHLMHCGVSGKGVM